MEYSTNIVQLAPFDKEPSLTRILIHYLVRDLQCNTQLSELIELSTCCHVICKPWLTLYPHLLGGEWIETQACKLAATEAAVQRSCCTQKLWHVPLTYGRLFGANVLFIKCRRLLLPCFLFSYSSSSHRFLRTSSAWHRTPTEPSHTWGHMEVSERLRNKRRWHFDLYSRQGNVTFVSPIYEQNGGIGVVHTFGKQMSH